MEEKDIIEVLLNNPDLMKKHGYDMNDIKSLDLENDFINFVNTVIEITESNFEKKNESRVKKIFLELNIK